MAEYWLFEHELRNGYNPLLDRGFRRARVSTDYDYCYPMYISALSHSLLPVARRYRIWSWTTTISMARLEPADSRMLTGSVMYLCLSNPSRAYLRDSARALGSGIRRMPLRIVLYKSMARALRINYGSKSQHYALGSLRKAGR